jgi:hypothetical protein
VLRRTLEPVAREAFRCRRMAAPRPRPRLRPPTRVRGAGRPRAQASRSSAKSGDSGDSDSEPPRRGGELRHVGEVIAEYLHSLENER